MNDKCNYSNPRCSVPKGYRLNQCRFWSKKGCTLPTLRNGKQLEELKATKRY